MNKRRFFRKGAAGGLAVMLMAFQLLFFQPVKVSAANFLFITDVRLRSGETAYEDLEADGYRVMTIGLNTGTEDTTPVFLGYKLNEGTPITDLRIRENVGQSFDTEAGIHYVLSGDTDVDEGSPAKAGCIYYTTDARAGEPLAALDIIRADHEENEELLAIPNDGSVVVRKMDNTPADIEARRQDVVMYLMMIRDHLVRPYVSEIALVTDEDRWNAVYTAAERGYDYYIDGDLDAKEGSYTLLAYNRTADASQAVTSVVGVAKDLAESLEKDQFIALPEEERIVDELDSEPVEKGTVKEDAGEGTGTDSGTTSGTAAEPETSEGAALEPRVIARVAANGTDVPVLTDTKKGAEAENEPGQENAPDAGTGSESDSDDDPEGSPEAASESAKETETQSAEQTTAEPAEDNTAASETAKEETSSETVKEEETASETEEDEPASETEEESTTESEEATTEEETTEEQSREVLSGEALMISGIEYVRVSENPVQAETPYYLYVTKSKEAGNPVSTFYTGWQNLSTETFFGMWTYGFFSAKGVSHAGSYTVNEDLLNELQTDMTVCINIPVSLLGGSTEGSEKSGITPEIKTLPLSMLTKKEGLPSERVVINGLTKRTENPPVIERNERSDRANPFSGSAIGKISLPVILAGGAAILTGAAVSAVVIRRRKKGPEDKGERK